MQPFPSVSLQQPGSGALQHRFTPASAEPHAAQGTPTSPSAALAYHQYRSSMHGQEDQAESAPSHASFYSPHTPIDARLQPANMPDSQPYSGTTQHTPAQPAALSKAARSPEPRSYIEHPFNSRRVSSGTAAAPLRTLSSAPWERLPPGLSQNSGSPDRPDGRHVARQPSDKSMRPAADDGATSLSLPVSASWAVHEQEVPATQSVHMHMTRSRLHKHASSVAHGQW